MRLGTLLLRDGVIGIAELEQGLARQITIGGKLGTNLVELGFINIDVLANYLGEILRVPVASHAAFMAASPSAIAKISPSLAKQHLAVPLGTVGDDFAVAFADPTSDHLHSVQEAISQPFTPYVAPDMRVAYFLEQFYGVPRDARYFRPSSPVFGQSATVAGVADVIDAHRRTRAPSGLEMPTPIEIRPRASSLGFPKVSLDDSPRISREDSKRALERATSRDAIADAILHYAQGRTPMTALFVVQSGYALGWRKQGAAFASRMIEEISIALGPWSAFQMALDNKEPMAAPMDSIADRNACAQLGVAPPSDPERAYLIPIIQKGRPINLWYAHGGNAAAFEGMREVAEVAGAAYERLFNSR